MKRLVLVLLLSASGICLAMRVDILYSREKRLLERLKLCTSFRKQSYEGALWGNSAGFSHKETIDHASMWHPDESQVKQRCDIDFAQWIKVRQQLDQFEREQE